MYHFFLLLLGLPFLLLLLGRFSPGKEESLRLYPIVGNLPQFVANRHRLLDWFTDLVRRSPTNTVFLRRLGVRVLLTANPANIEHVHRTNFDNYAKGRRFTSNLHDFLGQGIFNSDGDQWRLQRKTASFEFNTRSLRNFVVDCVQHEISTGLLPALAAAAREPHAVIDLQEVLEGFAFDSICKVAFNTDPSTCAGGAAFPAAFKHAAVLSAERFRYAFPGIWKIKKLLDAGTESTLRRSVATVHEFADSIIRSRRKDPGKHADAAHDDLLSRFMAKGDDCSDRFLRDIVISFLLAGRETTSSALAWFFWVLSTRPDVEGKLLEEVRTTRASRGLAAGEMLGFDDLREMQYLHAAISESMRLYPPVPLNSMTSLEDDVLPDGSVVRKGWAVSYSSYAMGRMESIWGDDCLDYRPERWLDDHGIFRAESPFKFPAFHGGPRMCLGKEMAYIQMKSVAACVLERFEVDVVGKHRLPEYMLSLTLRMKNGLLVKVKERARTGTCL